MVEPAAGPGPVGVQTITDLPQLIALAPAWRVLSDLAPAASVFQHPDWALAWCRTLGADSALQVQAAFRDGELVGLAPLAIDAGDGRAARFVGAPLNDFNDFLVHPQDPAPVFAALWRQVLDPAAGWAALELTPIRPDAALRINGHLPNLTGAARELLPVQPAPLLRLEDDWEAYRARLPARHRRQWERTLARTLADHTVQVQPVEDPHQLADAVARFERLRRSSWTARGRLDELVPTQRDDRSPQFLAAAAAALAGAGHCLLIELAIDHTLAAADLYLTRARSALLYLRAFNIEAAEHSPGVMLAILGLKLLHARGYREVSLGRGGEAFKYHLGGQDVPLERVVLRRSP